MTKGNVFVSGASRGIGKNIATYFAKNNYKVVGTSRNDFNVDDARPLARGGRGRGAAERAPSDARPVAVGLGRAPARAGGRTRPAASRAAHGRASGPGDHVPARCSCALARLRSVPGVHGFSARVRLRGRRHEQGERL